MPITVMYNIFFIGVGMELLHLREQENCNGVRELEPIDQNLQYDSNFQNMVHLDEKSVQQVSNSKIASQLYTYTIS